MIYNALASVIAPFYGVGRAVLSIAAKVFLVYGVVVAIAAFAADRGLESFALYGRLFAFSVAARLAIVALDALARRCSAAARSVLTPIARNTVAGARR